MARKKSSFDFEHSLEELENLVDQVEAGELSLEESLTAFERGVKLTRQCQQALDEAEQRLEALLDREQGDLDGQEAGD